MFIPLQLSDNEAQLEHSTGMHSLTESDLAMEDSTYKLNCNAVNNNFVPVSN